MTAGPERSTRSLLSIQILRAVAALGVVLAHIFPGAVIGTAGVDLFFVISGFIMVYASERLFGRREAPRIFFLRRLARIVPLYWAVTAVLVAYPLLAGVDLAAVNLSPGAILGSFVFFPLPRPDGSLLPVHFLGWTLNYEMFFYAVFAGFIVFSRQRAVAAIIALFIAIVILGLAFKPPQPFAFWADPIILEFCFGMLIASAYRDGARLPPPAAAGLIVAAAMAFAASAAWGHHLTWRVAEWGLPAAALVAGCALSKGSPNLGVVSRALGLLGDASYSLYLVHLPVFLVVRKAWSLRGPADAPWLLSLALFASAIMAAIVVYVVFENPSRRWLQRKIEHHRSDATPPVRSPVPTLPSSDHMPR
jgi:exopolysaccharide production protein ExoZ